MMLSGRYWILLITSMITACCLWRTTSFSWPVSSVRAKASIQLDLSIPSPASTLLSLNSFRSNGSVRRVAGRGRVRENRAASRYMLNLYHRRPEADIVRALQPTHVSGPVYDGGRILEFDIPSIGSEESLQTAELLGTAGTILRVRSMDQDPSQWRMLAGKVQSRREDTWRAFNVTSALLTLNGNTLRLHIRGRLQYHPIETGPILLLSYSKKSRRKRQSRSTPEQDDPEEATHWEEDGSRKRRRNACRRRPLYVDFALIAYDEWVVAPPGYEAYQCAGKCLYPLGDHLSPTKHAIVQTLVHGALQGEGLNSNKHVGRACCVPTRLAPTSLLYLDATGTLTYQYGYEDMVVAECGCR